MLAMLIMNRIASKRRNARKQAAKPAKAEKRSAMDCCRTCLSGEDLVSLFYSKENEATRTEELRLVTGLEIKMDDGLPQKICTKCVDIMNTALQFRRKSKKAEKTLLNMLNGTLSKRKMSKPLKIETKEEICDVEFDTTEADEAVVNYDDYNTNYDSYGDDFQNYDCDVKEEEVKPNVKSKPGPKKKRTTIPNASSYKCTTCNKEFRMKATYKAHMRFHTNYCVCESCGKRCRNNNQLQEHKRARHGLGRIHKCAYCEYSSATKEALVIHERRHTGERPYICDHCGATFHRRSNLVQHIAIHLPEKNFQCPICPKREKSRKLLAIHEYKAHRKNRFRYICPVCSETFTRPGNVRQHLSRSHAVARDDQGLIERIQIVSPLHSAYQ